VGTILGSIGSIIVGGVVAIVTIIGLVTSSVDSSSDNPANVNAPSIDYGSSNN
jgi:hypothetical protein